MASRGLCRLVDRIVELVRGRMTTMPSPPDPPYGPWTAAWAGMATLAVANGLSRGLYAGRLGDERAHQVSTATLIAALLPCHAGRRTALAAPQRQDRRRCRHDLGGPDCRVRARLRHYVVKQSWQTLLADYDLRRGQLWPLVLVAIAATRPRAGPISRKVRS